MSSLLGEPNPQRRWVNKAEQVDGYDVPVYNEREVRASAGILFALGFAGYLTVLLTGEVQPMRAFGMLFVIDMSIRLLISPRFSPTMTVGRLIVYRQRPEFVGASQKTFAWWMGWGLATASCFALGWLGLPLPIILVLCGLCVTLLFLETAFGICVGCELQRRFSRQKPQYCPGDVCTYNPRG